MQRFSPAIWLACLALLMLCASCGGGMNSSPIQPELDAQSLESDSASAAPARAPAGILPTAWCSLGYAKVNHHFNYYSAWGNVSKAGQTLTLQGSASSSAGVRYYLRPNAAVPVFSKICWLRFFGSGTTMQARCWDYSTSSYTPWTTLSMAGGYSQPYWVINYGNAARQVRLELRSPVGQTNRITAIYALVD